jgi:hypothetical protein
MDEKRKKRIIKEGAASIEIETRHLLHQVEKVSTIMRIYDSAIFGEDHQFRYEPDRELAIQSMKFKDKQIELLTKAIANLEKVEKLLNESTAGHTTFDFLHNTNHAWHISKNRA